MAIDLSTLQSLGLPEITLWLLSFAILYGLMSQVKIPESQAARAIISIVIAFFVILSAPLALTNVLSKMTSSLVIVLIGIIVLLIFVEVAGIKSYKTVPVIDEKGKETGKLEHVKVPIFEAYGYLFVAAFLAIAALIFVNSGLVSW